MPDENAIEARVLATLQALDVPYELIAVDPDFADTAAFCERYGFPPALSGNTILVATKREPKRFCACVVQATAKLDVNHAVRRLMDNAKLSFATADETRALTGMMIGGVTPFGLPDTVPLYLDAPLMHLPWIIVGGGSRSVKVKVAPSALGRLANAEVVEGLATPLPPT